MRQHSTLLLIVVWGLQALTASAYAEPAIPMPQEASPLSETHEVRVGSGILEVQGFATTMDLASLEAFYEKALPKAGWRIEPLPWQAQQTHITTELEHTMKMDRAAAADPKLREHLRRSQEAQEALRQELYASQGREHVILHFMPFGSGQMAVFINRWTGDAEWMASGLGATSSPMASWLNQPNVCCSGQEIPDSQGSLPFGIPRYPGAKLLSKSTPKSGDSASLLLKTPDAGGAVADFYRKQMAYNGWEPFDIGERVSQMASEGATAGAPKPPEVLMYRNARQLCGLTIQVGSAHEASAAPSSGEPPGTLVTIMIMPRPTLPGAGK